MRALTLALLAAAALCACGETPPWVEIEVVWSQYRVPDDIDALHFELSDQAGVFVERSYRLPDDAPPASLVLSQGERTPAELRLVVYGLREESTVVESSEQPVSFEQPGARYRVELP